MRKADIYFKGDIIQTVECDGVHKILSVNNTVLVIGTEEKPEKIVAVIPFDHLIIFREVLTVEIKGSDLIGTINSTNERS